VSVIFAILSILVGLVALYSASLDFRGDPQIMELMQRLGYRPGFERTLGVIKVLGAVGLFLGIVVHFIGVLAALGLTIYMLLAIRAHFRASDPVKEALPAFVLMILSATTLIVGLLG